MTVRRIVANRTAAEPGQLRDFYKDLLDLEVVMDLGWIVTLAADTTARPQLSIASSGGSGTAVPDISIEVDDVDCIYERARSQACGIVYEITDEPWGVRRFYVRDPAGTVLNILSHIGSKP